MNDSARDAPSPFLDEPRRRLVWIFPLAILLWAAVLLGFGLIVERRAPSAPEVKPVEVGIVELPPAGGSRGPAAPSHQQSHTEAAPKAAPEVHHRTIVHHVHRRVVFHHHERIKPIHPIEPPSRLGAASPQAPPVSKSAAPAVRTASIPSPAARAKGGTSVASGVSGGNDGGSGLGLGSGNLGAHAIYAPAPVIPEDLRDNAFAATAIARFIVTSSGSVKVTLVKPTSSPELNAILLGTLRNWRFFPATKGGAAIDSQFDIRIPISVR